MSKVLIFPTDTVYGIGASVYDEEGIKKIYKIKNRPLDKPLAILCANVNQIEEIGYLTDDAKKLIEAFLPGPLTIIIKSKDNIIKSMGLKTIGVRIPKYDKALEILMENGPMATTSVNESGMPSINNYNEIVSSYKDVVDGIYKPTNDKTSSLASTVVSIVDNDVKILREGAISLNQILSVLNNID